MIVFTKGCCGFNRHVHVFLENFSCGLQPKVLLGVTRRRFFFTGPGPDTDLGQRLNFSSLYHDI
jgi:hypothetical protein